MLFLDAYDTELARYLYEKYVVEKVSKTYGDVSKELEKITGIHKDPHMALPYNLGRVSRFCCEKLGLPLISLGVHTKAGTTSVKVDNKLSNASIETRDLEFDIIPTLDEPVYPDENPSMSEGAKKQVIIDIRERNPIGKE